jgi:hypothetical protein
VKRSASPSMTELHPQLDNGIGNGGFVVQRNSEALFIAAVRYFAAKESALSSSQCTDPPVSMRQLPPYLRIFLALYTAPANGSSSTLSCGSSSSSRMPWIVAMISTRRGRHEVGSLHSDCRRSCRPGGWSLTSLPGWSSELASVLSHSVLMLLFPLRNGSIDRFELRKRGEGTLSPFYSKEGFDESD